MAALEAAFSIFSPYPSSSTKFPLCPKTSPSIKLQISTSTPSFFLKFPLCPFSSLSSKITKKPSFEVCCSSVQDVAVEENPEKIQLPNQRRKLFMLNLPWSYTVVDIRNIFGECGTVSDVEIIKQKDGKNRGFAFVTMASGEEAQAVIEKFDSQELLGRIIKVEFAKRFKKPSRPPPTPTSTPPGETRHKLYVSNLAWEARSTHLREFFTANSRPVSARVVFDNPSGRSAGYGFVSFATKEEAEAAISALDGKELLGRPLRLQFSEKYVDESVNKEEGPTEGQPAVID